MIGSEADMQVTDALGEILVEMNTLDEAFYDPPPGFEKPKSYPKITSVFGGTKWKVAMGKGFVDLGLIDPDKPPANVERVRSSILRSVVKLLITSKGDNAFIRDPEAVLPKVLGHIKVNLKANLEEALEAMYDKPIAVTVAGVKTKKGVPGWRINAHGLAAHVPDA
jgi:hypothetical protein